MNEPCIHPLLLNQSLVLISCSLIDFFSEEQLAVIGAYLTTLGDMISLNSTYCSFIKDQNEKIENKEDDYDLLEKSIDKIKEEIEKIKKA